MLCWVQSNEGREGTQLIKPLVEEAFLCSFCILVFEGESICVGICVDSASGLPWAPGPFSEWHLPWEVIRKWLLFCRAETAAPGVLCVSPCQSGGQNRKGIVLIGSGDPGSFLRGIYRLALNSLKWWERDSTVVRRLLMASWVWSPAPCMVSWALSGAILEYRVKRKPSAFLDVIPKAIIKKK